MIFGKDRLPDTKVGTFTQELYDEAKKNGWLVISMKNDWKRIFGFEASLRTASHTWSSPEIDLLIAARRSTAAVDRAAHVQRPVRT